MQKASSFISDDMMAVSSSATIYNTLVDAAKKSISNIISQIEKTFGNNNHKFHSILHLKKTNSEYLVSDKCRKIVTPRRM